ncbi:MAG: type phosphodiesterase/nucleotide pyrophosphatase [Myxococcales bacterium]|nr:type phosphodiesterase/nucleotide pyrophosphatase [Myxococcales bacterium]
MLFVIDQWPEWSFEDKRAALDGGFDRLLREGEWHVGRHPSAATLTAPGHALLGTGEPPARSGILANEWWHRDLGRVLRAVEAEDGSIGARWLRVPGLGDAVAMHDGAKAVGISMKERAAILPLGHRGIAIWYDPKIAGMKSNSEIAWLADYNRDHPIAPQPWTPLDAARLPGLSGVADDQPGETGEKGFGATFPHDPAKTRDPVDAVFAMPLGNELVLDTATAAIDREHLGADEVPDVLVISLSAHDYIGHGWGHESWEAWDAELRLDQRIATFVDDLDRKVGAGRWAMIVTSDHGASPMPERSQGGRLTHHQIQVAANNAASAVLGQGDWIDNAHYPSVYFSKAALAQPKGELASATKRVINALRSFPGIDRVDLVANVAGHCESRTGITRTLCLTFDPERSGDIFYMPAKGWIMETEDEPVATAHGSMNDYDRLVPVILIPPGRHAHDPQTAPATDEIDMVRIAPILAGWLGVPAPSQLPR